MLFQTDVVLMNLEAGQKPKLTAEWDKRSLSHSRGSLLWQASRWPFVEITNQIRERERVRGRSTFSTTARPPTQIAFSCCHGKNERKENSHARFSDAVFYHLAALGRWSGTIPPTSPCLYVWVWPLGDLWVTSVWPLLTSEWPLCGLCWPLLTWRVTDHRGEFGNLREQLSCFLHHSVRAEFVDCHWNLSRNLMCLF